MLYKKIKGDKIFCIIFQTKEVVMEQKSKAIEFKETTSISTGVFYGMGGAGLQLCWFMIVNYLTLFYTDVVGLTASAISAIMLIARIWDAINDPMMGVIADRTKTRWGRYRPYLMIAPPVMAIFNVLTFTVFPLAGIAKVIVCLLTYIGAGMAYTALSICLNSLANVIAKSSRVRVNYVTFRSSAMAIINIILSSVAMPLILKISGSEVANAKGYFGTTVLFSVIMMILFWLCAWRVKEPQEEINRIMQTREKMSIMHSFKVVAKNKYLLMICINTLLACIATQGRMSMLSYYVIYCMGSYTLIAPIYTIMSATCLLGTILMPFTTKLIGKRNVVIVYNLVAIACFITIFFLPSSSVGMILFITAIIGICSWSAAD